MDDTKDDKISAKLIMRLRNAVGLPVSAAKDYLDKIPVSERELLVVTAERHNDGYIHDPIEDDPLFISVIDSVRKETEKELKIYQQKLIDTSTTQSTFTVNRVSLKYYDIIMKRILKECYNIEWRSLREMNQHITFD